MNTIAKVHGKDHLGFILILLSSILLGIWAVKGTIALRNILLGVETLLSFFYCYLIYKTHPKIPFKNWTPLLLLGLMFLWVIFHYFFLSRFPEQQLHELKSTWLRSGLASIVGMGTGWAILRRPNCISLLWSGILGSFFFLLYQYLPNAIALKSFFAPDYVNYIFYGKISGVLAGTILLVGLLGTLLDGTKRANWFTKLMMGIFALIGFTLVLYSYIYVFDTRNGVGLAVILLGIFCVALIGKLIITGVSKLGCKKPSFKWDILLLLIAVTLVILMGWAVKKHINHNSGWSSFWEDAKISVQIEKYSNWQNPQDLGYPNNASGRPVKANTYERLAWATAGVSLFLPKDPYGLGILKNSFTILMKENYPNSNPNLTSTHSAWVEIGLAFGYPGLGLMLGALLSLAVLAPRSNSIFATTVLLFALGLTMLYAVGEISSQHSIEVLFFLIALNSALLMFSPSGGQDSRKASYN